MPTVEFDELGLLTYLLRGQDVAQRNTVFYRLRRIEAIAEIDLGDPETRLLLHLALRVGRVIPVVTRSLKGCS